MTKTCVISNCKTGNKSLAVKRSVFKVPADDILRQKWQTAIAAVFPKRSPLKSNQFVCERHFQPNSILRKYVKHDANGKMIAEALYKHPKLVPDAVPNIFTDEANSISSIKHSVDPLANEEPMESDLPQRNEELTIDLTTNAMMMNEGGISNASLPQEASIINEVTVDRIIDEVTVEQNDTSTIEALIVEESGIPNIEMSASTAQVISNNKFDSIHLPCQASTDNNSSESSTVPKLRVFNTGCVGDEKNSITLPESWSVCQSTVKLGTEITFCQIMTSADNNVKKLVVKKYIVIENWSGNMQYYVHGKQVSVDESQLPQILKDVSLLPVVLIKFEKMRVCTGAGFVDSSFIMNDAFQDNSCSWHHNRCSLLTKKNKCDSCKAWKKIVWQRRKRSIKNTAAQRGFRVLNPQDEKKLTALRQKLNSQRRRNNRAKLEIKKLKESLQEKQAEVAALNLKSFAEKCNDLKIPETQQIAMKEMIAAAQSKPKGRRYSEDWLMLCMLMNIRSPSNYEFLRTNKIIPLPCTRTIRNYFSIIDTKCGFVASFAQLHSKHFATKKPMQRYGTALGRNKSSKIGHGDG